MDDVGTPVVTTPELAEAWPGMTALVQRSPNPGLALPANAVILSAAPAASLKCPYALEGLVLLVAPSDGGLVTPGVYPTAPATVDTLAPGHSRAVFWASQAGSLSGRLTLTSTQPFAGSFDITFERAVAPDAGSRLQGSFSATSCGAP